MHRKNILGEINSGGENGHDFPLLWVLVKTTHSIFALYNAVCGNFAATSGRGNPFHLLERHTGGNQNDRHHHSINDKLESGRDSI